MLLLIRRTHQCCYKSEGGWPFLPETVIKMGGTGSLGSMTGLASDTRSEALPPMLVLCGIGGPNRGDIRILRWSRREDLLKAHHEPPAYSGEFRVLTDTYIQKSINCGSLTSFWNFTFYSQRLHKILIGVDKFRKI